VLTPRAWAVMAVWLDWPSIWNAQGHRVPKARCQSAGLERGGAESNGRAMARGCSSQWPAPSSAGALRPLAALLALSDPWQPGVNGAAERLSETPSSPAVGFGVAARLR